MKKRVMHWLCAAGLSAIGLLTQAAAGAKDVASEPAAASAPLAREPKASPTRAIARVYQQRTPEGGILLTDQPLDEARTERTWALEREDTEAARARSNRVSAEAKTVSERVQKRIDRDQQLRDADVDRQQVAAAAAEADRHAADAEPRYAIGTYLPYGTRARYRQVRPRFDDRPAPRSGRGNTLNHTTNRGPNSTLSNAPALLDRE